MHFDDGPAIMRVVMRRKQEVSLNVLDTRVASQHLQSGSQGKGPPPFGIQLVTLIFLPYSSKKLPADPSSYVCLTSLLAVKETRFSSQERGQSSKIIYSKDGGLFAQV